MTTMPAAPARPAATAPATTPDATGGAARYTAAMSELTLYVDANYESPWALTAFVALEEKQLPYRLET